MKSWRVTLNLAVFVVLFVVMVGWAVNNLVSVDQLEKPYALSADFANAFGVGPNAEVTYRGVPYGSITSVRRVPGGVRVKMKVKNKLKVPEGATANLLRKSVVGEPYVDFEPPTGWAGNGPFLAAGAVIPRDHTTVPLEFSELLRSASALVSSIPPSDVSTLLHEAATGLSGRADSLRQITESGDRLSATLAQQTDALDRLMTNGTRLTHVVTQHRDSLGQSLTDLENVAASLKNARGDLSTLLDTAPPLLTQAADLVANQKANLDCDLKILGVIVDETSTPRRLAELAALLEIGPKANDQLFDATDVEPDGRWIRVGLVSNTNNKPPVYIPPKALPAAKPVPDCTSALTPALLGGQARAASAGPASSTLPATGGTGLLILGTAFATAFLIVRLMGSGVRSQG
jgi:phospholipid/cholesterol/gamma-HCH transport system substrate-binding protein